MNIEGRWKYFADEGMGDGLFFELWVPGGR